MSDATQDRIAALRQLAAETQQRVTKAKVRPHKRGKTQFKVAKLVAVERVELHWLASQVTLPDDADDAAKLEALRDGSAAAKSDEVAIQLADLHWLLAFFPEPVASDEPGDDEPDTVLADDVTDQASQA